MPIIAGFDVVFLLRDFHTIHLAASSEALTRMGRGYFISLHDSETFVFFYIISPSPPSIRNFAIRSVLP